jgi:hypothetical protein
MNVNREGAVSGLCEQSNDTFVPPKAGTFLTTGVSVQFAKGNIIHVVVYLSLYIYPNDLNNK